MNKVPVYILAGGESSRFGSDKARAPLGGVPMIRRVAEALEPVAQSVTAVAATVGAYEDLGFTTIGDRCPGLGPLGGLDAALADRVAHHQEGWFLLASCDLAEPSVGLARELIGHIRPDAQVVAFKGERWEPLFALYHATIREAVRRQIDAGHGALWKLIESVRHVAVALPNGVIGIDQINTRREYDQRHGARGHD